MTLLHAGGRRPAPFAADCTATVAERTAARLLALAGVPDGGGLACEIGWAGPVALPLTDERAVQAACGLMHVHGRAAGRPAPLAVDYAAVVAGVLAAQGVLAALLARAAGTAVTAVRTSAAQGALLALGQYLAAATAPSEAEGRQDHPPPGSGECGATLVSADGVRFEVETLDAAPWREWWHRLGAATADAAGGWRAFQQRFATAVCPLPAALRETAARTPYAAVRTAAAAAGVSVLPVREDPRAPEGVPPWRLRPFPGGGAAPSRAAAAPPAARPLAGVRVVESARRVQGPLAGHVLRLLGAEVLRVEPPGGDPTRGVPPLADGCSARFAALNAGKAVVEADITTQAGRSAVRELVSRADVFLHNWAPGKAARLRLDSGDLRRVRPGLVYARASGWGDAFGAAPPTGTDYLVQAHSGLAAAVRPDGEPPAPSLATLTDVLGGLVCALGVLAALHARAPGGPAPGGARVDSSLLSAAALVPRPRTRVVWGPLDRPLAVQDGHLALGPAARAAPARTARAAGLPASAPPARIVERLRARPAAVWLARLAEAGLTATRVCEDLAALPADPAFRGALARGAYAAPCAPWELA